MLPELENHMAAFLISARTRQLALISLRNWRRTKREMNRDFLWSNHG